MYSRHLVVVENLWHQNTSRTFNWQNQQAVNAECPSRIFAKIKWFYCKRSLLATSQTCSSTSWAQIQQLVCNSISNKKYLKLYLLNNSRPNFFIIQTDLHVWKTSESGEESHGFTRSWRSTQNNRFMFSEPAVEEMFVSHCVYGWYNQVCSSHSVCLYLYLRYSGRPCCPFTF